MSSAHIRANEVQKTIEPVRQPEPELIRRQEQGPAQAVAPQDAYRRANLNRNGLRPADLLALQRTVGNRGVQRMVAQRQQLHGIFGGAVQLQGALEDEEPLQGQLATAQRQTAEEEEEPLQGQFETAQRQEDEEDELRMKAAPVTPAQLEAESPPSPNRTGLPDGLKTGIESLSGMSLDNAKVHYNSSQPAQLNALAYAQGSDIHIAPGQEQHLPHEAWHVIQQAQGRVKPKKQMKDGVPINDDEGLEHEADVMGVKALAPSAQLTGGPQDEELLQGKPALEHTLKTPATQQGGRRAAQRSAAPSPALSSFNPAQHHRMVGRVGVQPSAYSVAPIQRTLDFKGTLTANDVGEVTELKVGAVYRLIDANDTQRSLIIKVEKFSENVPRAEYAARHEATTALARAFLSSAPGVNPLTAEDFTAIGDLDSNLPGGGVTGLKAAVGKANGPEPYAAFKAQQVDVGMSLKDIFWDAKGGDAPKAETSRLLGYSGIMHGLGRMAAFDLIVGNADRFFADVKGAGANLANLDFTKSGAVALDNVDPNSRLAAGEWGEAEAAVRDGGSRKRFAESALAWVYLKAGGLGEVSEDQVNHFVAGMNEILGEMRQHAQQTLKSVGTRKGNADRGHARDEIKRRLKTVKP